MGGETGCTLSATVGPTTLPRLNALFWSLPLNTCVQLGQFSRWFLRVRAWVSGNWPHDKSRNVSESGQGAAPAIRHSWAEGCGQFLLSNLVHAIKGGKSKQRPGSRESA